MCSNGWRGRGRGEGRGGISIVRSKWIGRSLVFVCCLFVGKNRKNGKRGKMGKRKKNKIGGIK